MGLRPGGGVGAGDMQKARVGVRGGAAEVAPPRLLSQ